MAATLAACSDPRAATATNFRRVIAPLVVDRYCMDIRAAALDTLADAGKPASAWPIVLAEKPSLYEQMTRLDARQLLDDAARRGLVERTPSVALARSRNDEPYRRQLVLSYRPTALGRASFRSVDRSTSDARTIAVPARCVATGELGDIVRWTDPGDAFGTVLTTVTYTVGAKDVTAIVTDPADRARLAAPVERTIVLQRTSDGWRPFGDR